jgi:hypothetical protein
LITFWGIANANKILHKAELIKTKLIRLSNDVSDDLLQVSRCSGKRYADKQNVFQIPNFWRR